jgi:hypothetical protein
MDGEESLMEPQTTEQCDPPDSDWCVTFIIGKTFCPDTVEHGKTCAHREVSPTEHDRKYGTETSDTHVYYKGARPDFSAIVDEIMTAPWYVIEHTIRRCPNPADESVCRWCSGDIVFAQNGDTRWGTDGEPDDTFCGSNPEDDRHEPEDEYNDR